MLRAVRERAEKLGLELKDIEELHPPRFAIVRDTDDDGCYAIVNDDGLPLFTFAQVELFLQEVEDTGDFEAWQYAQLAENQNEDDDADNILEAWLGSSRLLMPEQVMRELRDEIRVVVIQELLRHKLIESSIPLDGEIIPPPSSR